MAEARAKRKRGAAGLWALGSDQIRKRLTHAFTSDLPCERVARSGGCPGSFLPSTQYPAPPREAILRLALGVALNEPEMPGAMSDDFADR
jgi:hypothetical protein